MNIAQVVCVYPPYKGGIGTSAVETAKIFESLDHQVTTFTPNYSNNQSQNSYDNKNVVYLKPWLKKGNGAFLPQLSWSLKKFDLVYLHYPFFGGAEAVWMHKLLHRKSKLLLHFHHDAVSQGLAAKILGLPDGLIRASLFQVADKIVSASLDYVRESEIKNLYQKHQEKFQEIPFSVDIKNFFSNNKIGNQKPKILFVGGLDQAHYFKGINILLEAVSLLPHQNWILEIVGGGDLQSTYEAQAKDLEINQNVIFRGRLNDEDLQSAYREADIFVLPSTNKGEAFGIVLLEAMASKLPVITTNLAGVRNVFQNEREGLIVEPNDAKSLNEALDKLLRDQTLRLRMGEAGQKLVEQKYSKDIIKEKYKNLLKQIANT